MLEKKDNVTILCLSLSYCLRKGEIALLQLLTLFWTGNTRHCETVKLFTAVTTIHLKSDDHFWVTYTVTNKRSTVFVFLPAVLASPSKHWDDCPHICTFRFSRSTHGLSLSIHQELYTLWDSLGSNWFIPHKKRMHRPPLLRREEARWNGDIIMFWYVLPSLGDDCTAPCAGLLWVALAPLKSLFWNFIDELMPWDILCYQILLNSLKDC